MKLVNKNHDIRCKMKASALITMDICERELQLVLILESISFKIPANSKDVESWYIFKLRKKISIDIEIMREHCAENVQQKSDLSS